MSAFDWVELVAKTLLGMASLAVSVLWYVFIYHVWRHFSQHYMARRSMPSLSVLLRRPFCRHRHIARTRDRYGRHYTACVRCALDVNSGRPREEWR